MTNKNSGLVIEMIDELETDEIMKDAMKKIVDDELRDSTQNNKVKKYREIIEKVVNNEDF